MHKIVHVVDGRLSENNALSGIIIWENTKVVHDVEIINVKVGLVQCYKLRLL